MSNHTGNLHLITVIIDEDNLEEGLKEIISIDEDYSEVQDQVVKELIDDNDTVDEMVDALLEYGSIKTISAFITGNPTFCHSYQVSVDEFETGKHYVALAYVT